MVQILGRSDVGEGTLPWDIICFRIFSNYFSQKYEKKNNGLKE